MNSGILLCALNNFYLLYFLLWTRIVWKFIFMRVEKREFTWKFSQFSCPGQTRTRVAWELRSESLHESFLNSHVLVKREQELHESCTRVDWILPQAERKLSSITLVKIWTSSKSVRVYGMFYTSNFGRVEMVECNWNNR